MSELNYPLPRPNAHTRPFWEGTAAGQLRYQRCNACAQVQRIPRSLCENCQSAELQWQASDGRGRVLSFTVVHRAPLACFRQMTPYAIVIVDMAEGFRVMANALPEAQDALAIGSEVRIGFHEVQGMALPVVEAVLEDTP